MNAPARLSFSSPGRAFVADELGVRLPNVTRTPRKPGHVGPRWAGVALLFALVLLTIYRSHLGTRLDSFTIDEPYHIVAGASYVRTGDFRLNPEHPPLMKLWLGASMPESFKLRPFRPLNEKVEERDYTEESVFYDNDAAAVQRRARLSLWIYHGLLLLSFGLLMWRVVGLAWAAGALAYVAIEPTVGAHLPLAMTDLSLALTLGITVVAAALVLTTWSWRWVAVLGVAIGLALGSKHSALPGLVGIGAVCFAAAVCVRLANARRTVPARLVKLAAAALIGWALLWAQYGGRFHASRDGTDPFNSPMTQKLNDLRGNTKHLIAAGDKYQLMPRAYLWGLADTVRTGVEGRGVFHFFYGKWYEGAAPKLFWPGVIAAKVPLFLLAFSLLGIAVLWHAPLSREARWLLLSAAAMAGAHLLALFFSKGTWGGIRHALPVVFALCFFAGAAIWRAWQLRSRALALACVACWVAAFAMTIREPRLWEYGNELVGGSDDSYRYFMNEGQDLGQRYGEFKAFHDSVIAPSGKPFYGTYWFIEEQAKADKVRYSRFTTGLEDNNSEGVFEGYYFVKINDLIPAPHEHWDPAIFNGLERVARFGNTVVFRGRWVAPMVRAYSLRNYVIEAIFKNPAPDWELIAEKLEEIVQALPWSSATAILLGNAHLRLDRREQAVAAYEHALREAVAADPVRPALQAQLARLRSGEPLSALQPLRSSLLE